MSSSSAPDETTVSLFQQNRRVYRIMVEENFLSHREVYSQLHATLTELDSPFRFLDVGCGDAAYSALALKGTHVSAYHGIDLAPEALGVAKRTLSSLQCPTTLQVGDYVDALKRYVASADVIWIGLSLHHCRNVAKEAVLREVRRILRPGGLFLFYENTSPDGESRDDWLARWDLQRPAWAAYDEADWNTMRDHVRSADFPETDANWRRLAERTGFPNARQLFVAPTDLFRMYAWS